MAPLASPDVSTISGSSDSSLLQPESSDSNEVNESKSQSISSVLEAHSSDKDVSPDDFQDASDTFVTTSFINEEDEWEEMMPASTSTKKRKASQDSRFGVKTLKTFAVNQSDQLTENQDSEEPLLQSSVIEDSQSETDTESTLSVIEAGEKQPLLVPQDVGCLESVEYDLSASSVGDYSMQSESDDTDSLSTPSDSPAKRKTESGVVSVFRNIDLGKAYFTALHSCLFSSKMTLHNPVIIPYFSIAFTSKH